MGERFRPIAKVLDVVKLQALYVVRKLGDLSVGPKLTLIWGFSSVGRAIALQAIGHRFDPGNLHQVSSLSYYDLSVKSCRSVK